MHSIDYQLVLALTSGCLFLLFVATLRHYSRDSFLPAESWLLLIGAGYGYLQSRHLPELPLLELSPELVIWLLLPILIFASGRNISARALTREWVPVFSYAVFGVVLTLFLIGIPLSYSLQVPLLDGLFFAAAVAATDPSAVAAIFQRFSIPERLSIILEGESVFNDSTAIVIFGLIGMLVITGQELKLGEALGGFIWSIAVAIPFGLLLGWLAGKLVAHWHEQNRFTGLTVTIVIAYSGYLIAESLLHVSGVITVLCTSLSFIRFRQSQVQVETDKLEAGTNHGSVNNQEFFMAFWEYLELLAGSLLFFALGVAVGAHEFPVSWIIPGVVLILLYARAVVVYGFALLLNLGPRKLPKSWQHVLMLGGLRGAVSAALVLMIPPDYEYRILMLCLVFVLCLYTLVVHPLLLRWYLQQGSVNE
ncbi:cation:proton antiporter [Amphritea balenae]|uniref:Sodium:proton antiporter n=1 Tax=Amphritea balenae TaxID=452629 RepID=A0A3P1SL60_9GAMM|nr:sodium:proton antiporter [Amphritea balenae]RRC97720.1 sodium:proton antiporter [Amphritea balenae]GGK82448.1 hypothetical protein GCM10007941_36140 [Amphritea balenae]